MDNDGIFVKDLNELSSNI